MTVALRIADINANNQTALALSMKISRLRWLQLNAVSMEELTGQHKFQLCKPGYDKNLATFQNRDNLILVPANDSAALEEVFKRSVMKNSSLN